MWVAEVFHITAITKLSEKIDLFNSIRCKYLYINHKKKKKFNLKAHENLLKAKLKVLGVGAKKRYAWSRSPETKKGKNIWSDFGMWSGQELFSTFSYRQNWCTVFK